MSGRFTSQSLAVGFMLGALILHFTRSSEGGTGYLAKISRLLRLILFFIKELIMANLRVAYDVLTPRHHMRPGVVAIPLDARTDAEITLLANLISLTPGTLSLAVSPDRRTLYVHAMYIRDADQVRRSIKEGFERRVLEVLR